MPMLTTVLIRFPVAPVHSPLRRRSVKAPIASSTACTSVTTSWPSTTSSASRGSRSAVCNTARSSEVLICTPANIWSRRSSRWAVRARSISSASVSRVTRCLL
ncbi:Uncharacterised protein [Mycobacterium tuberculosis]|uniref:Uncharacterized protein n=1 Tax=Mycobacterium tuberculosis TaxID=1773 RepID=A0A0U0TRE1_MYCTX|nr:Uncharacterised protein [Mycobacterium tuberculosis]COX39043.1 Uncharacterised protein [Mycobacterium tuberculosis]COX93537.1 Uncharacterised protein [Mycobacterium tuberculosis]